MFFLSLLAILLSFFCSFAQSAQVFWCLTFLVCHESVFPHNACHPFPWAPLWCCSKLYYLELVVWSHWLQWNLSALWCFWAWTSITAFTVNLFGELVQGNNPTFVCVHSCIFNRLGYWKAFPHSSHLNHFSKWLHSCLYRLFFVSNVLPHTVHFNCGSCTFPWMLSACTLVNVFLHTSQ